MTKTKPKWVKRQRRWPAGRWESPVDARAAEALEAERADLARSEAEFEAKYVEEGPDGEDWLEEALAEAEAEERDRQAGAPAREAALREALVVARLERKLAASQALLMVVGVSLWTFALVWSQADASWVTTGVLWGTPVVALLSRLLIDAQ